MQSLDELRQDMERQKQGTEKPAQSHSVHFEPEDIISPALDKEMRHFDEVLRTVPLPDGADRKEKLEPVGKFVSDAISISLIEGLNKGTQRCSAYMEAQGYRVDVRIPVEEQEKPPKGSMVDQIRDAAERECFKKAFGFTIDDAEDGKAEYDPHTLLFQYQGMESTWADVEEILKSLPPTVYEHGSIFEWYKKILHDLVLSAIAVGYAYGWNDRLKYLHTKE